MTVDPDGGLAAYIADYYGTCRLRLCVCNAKGGTWRGRFCEHWQPVPAKNWKELREWQAANDAKRKTPGGAGS